MIVPCNSYRRRRDGVTVVECAVVLPVFCLLVIGVFVGATGVFRYQEMAALAREGARWASVRGHTYEFYTAKPAATATDVYEQVIRPKSVALDQTRLTYSVTWEPDNRQGSRVTVRVNYQWLPEALVGQMKLSSSSSMIMSY